jgi:hypothetical protein
MKGVPSRSAARHTDFDPVEPPPRSGECDLRGASGVPWRSARPRPTRDRRIWWGPGRAGRLVPHDPRRVHGPRWQPVSITGSPTRTGTCRTHENPRSRPRIPSLSPRERLVKVCLPMAYVSLGRGSGVARRLHVLGIWRLQRRAARSGNPRTVVPRSPASGRSAMHARADIGGHLLHAVRVRKRPALHYHRELRAQWVVDPASCIRFLQR